MKKSINFATAYDTVVSPLAWHALVATTFLRQLKREETGHI